MAQASGFPPWGYTIVSLELTPATVQALLEAAEKAPFSPVFLDLSGTMDAYRSQSFFDDLDAGVAQADEHLRDVASCIHKDYEPQAYSFLKSIPGGQDQETHQDYPPANIKAVQKRYPGCVPASMILALQQETRLKVFAGCFLKPDEEHARILTIPVGFALIFRGDLFHCGVAYDETNYRVHSYLTLKHVPTVPDKVSGTKDAFECEWCGTLTLSSNQMRQHRFFCDLNPEGPERKKQKRARQNARGDFFCDICGAHFTVASSLRSHRRRYQQVT